MSVFAPVFDVRLDPPSVAVNRTELKLNDGPIRIDVAGIDWGDAAIQAYMADFQIGSSAVDYRIPNRTVHIPLFLGADESDDFDWAKGRLMQKVGRMQQEGGWLQRQPGLYADVVNATLTFPDVWGESAGVEPNIVLQLECLPDFYGDEIMLDAMTVATSANAAAGLVSMPGNVMFGPLQLSGAVARIRGNYPARCRLIVANSAIAPNYCQGLAWGLRGRYSDPNTTAISSFAGPNNATGVTNHSGAGTQAWSTAAATWPTSPRSPPTPRPSTPRPARMASPFPRERRSRGSSSISSAAAAAARSSMPRAREAGSPGWRSRTPALCCRSATSRWRRRSPPRARPSSAMAGRAICGAPR